MANVTKTCNITEEEIRVLIAQLAFKLTDVEADQDYFIERINYLNKRLKAFNETEKPETETKPTPAVAGWGTPST